MSAQTLQSKTQTKTQNTNTTARGSSTISTLIEWWREAQRVNNPSMQCAFIAWSRLHSHQRTGLVVGSASSIRHRAYAHTRTPVNTQSHNREPFATVSTQDEPRGAQIEQAHSKFIVWTAVFLWGEIGDACSPHTDLNNVDVVRGRAEHGGGTSDFNAPVHVHANENAQQLGQLGQCLLLGHGQQSCAIAECELNATTLGALLKAKQLCRIVHLLQRYLLVGNHFHHCRGDARGEEEGGGEEI